MGNFEPDAWSEGLRGTLAELAALAREIEARRTRVYQLSDDEKAAIDAARRSGFASDDGVAAFWKRYGLG
jgi:hypothetical protein